MDKHVLELDLGHKRHVYSCGDIHGRFDLLQKKLKALDFDPEQDVLIAVGDLIDRGPYSHRCLEFLRKDWFHSVSGNHEYAAVQGCFDSYLSRQHKRYGGDWFYRYDEDSRAIYASEFLKLPVVIEVSFEGRRFGFVHADVQGNEWQAFKQALRDHPDSHLHRGTTGSHAMESRSRIRDWFTGFNFENHHPITGIDEIYVGHSAFYSPFSLHNINYLDTGAYKSNLLTVVRLGDRLPQAPEFHPVYSTEEFWK